MRTALAVDSRLSPHVVGSCAPQRTATPCQVTKYFSFKHFYVRDVLHSERRDMPDIGLAYVGAREGMYSWSPSSELSAVQSKHKEVLL